MASNGYKRTRDHAPPEFFIRTAASVQTEYPGKRIVGVADDSKSRRAEDIVGDPEVRMV
jgi:hypothetical protein